jgi:hypothetical protein
MSKRVSRYGRFVFSLYVLLIAVFSAYSQSTTSLRGTVSDSQGGVIPGAVVTLTDRDKGASRQIVSIMASTRLALPPERIRSSRKPGFSTHARQHQLAGEYTGLTRSASRGGKCL